ncbi:MAG: hypothetical protein J2P47_06415 [Acetobacteraceae bacterium]|nr:hypothetical protein [Acetobacteraceae bacterium]
MKRLLVGVALLPLIGHQTFAAECASGPLTTYLAAGFSCTIGNDVNLSNFSYLPDGSGGGMTPAASAVTVSPGGTITSGVESGGLSVTFSGAWNAPAANSIADSSLSFTAASNDGDNLASTGLQVQAAAQGSGAFGSVTETVGGSQIVAGTDATPSATASTSGTTLDIVKDIEAFAGSGTASVSSLTETFSGAAAPTTPPPATPPAPVATPVPAPPTPVASVPEPQTWGILAVGVAMLGLARGVRRKVALS